MTSSSDLRRQVMPGSVEITISPTQAVVQKGSSVQFTANVVGSAGSGVKWTATLGSISPSGLYTAPTVEGAIVDTVAAISVADPSKYVTAEVTISSQPSAMGTLSQLGTYTNTSPAPASVVFYSGNPNSVTTKRLPADVMKHLASYGDVKAVAALTAGGRVTPSNAVTTWATPGSDDLATPLYYGQSSDRWFKLGSSAYPNGCPYTKNITLNAFHAPGYAPYSNPWRTDMNYCNDQNVRVWDQATGAVGGGYLCQSTTTGLTIGPGGSSSSTPGSFKVGSGCGAAKNAMSDRDWGNSNGWMNSQGAEGSANFAPMAGIVRSPEMIAGKINHALILTISCIGTYNGQWIVFPDITGDLWHCASTPNMPPAGALLFLDYTDTQIASMSIPAWEKTLITAMSHYGGYVSITGRESARGPFFQHESGLVYQLATGGKPTSKTTSSGVTGFYVSGGTKDPVFSYLRNQGVPCGSTSGTSDCKYNLTWFKNIPLVNGSDVTHHIHMADPCVAKGYANQPGGCY